jgi:hypothetical protein
MKPTVLLLSTYPIVDPRHGGQLRLINIGKAFASSGWHIESMSIYEPEAYGSARLGSRDIPFQPASSYRKYRGRDVPLINDLLTGAYATADNAGFPLVLKKLPKNIDAIHVEQPWLWPLAWKIKQLPAYKNTVLIYGSQNIEAPLKKEILASYDVSDADDVIIEIDALEQRAVCEADISVGVTSSDLNTLINWGAKNPILAPNGIASWEAKPENIEKWKAILPKTPWILYVASAHPPNFTGFTQCIGESLGCIPPDSRLVVAGSVCEHLYRHLATTRWNALNFSRLQLLHVLSDDDLAAVKTLAHAFLLPIPHGGGSNIKTAEALYSGSFVLGTEAAFRGFENFIDLPEVSVANSPKQFQSSMLSILAQAPTTTSQRKLRNTLRWDHCLSVIPKAVENLLKEPKPT